MSRNKVNTDFFTPINTTLEGAEAYAHNNGIIWLYEENSHPKYFRVEGEFRHYEKATIERNAN